VTRGILFDVDGTLVDTTYLHAVCWWQALRQENHDVPMAVVHRAIGMGSDRILDHLLGSQHDHAGDDALRAAHRTLFGTFWDRLRPTPGARQLLRACADRGLRVVLASSASPPELAALRRALGADEAIDTATGAADAAHSKPAPDIFTVALERSGLNAADVVVVGDSVWDFAAAGQLGIAGIGLLCGGLAEAELRDAGAAEVYPDPAGLLAALDRSLITRPSARVSGRHV
jgi:HAD superfamily hydrolase (TIGR01509 family)